MLSSQDTYSFIKTIYLAYGLSIADTLEVHRLSFTNVNYENKRLLHWPSISDYRPIYIKAYPKYFWGRLATALRIHETHRLYKSFDLGHLIVAMEVLQSCNHCPQLQNMGLMLTCHFMKNSYLHPPAKRPLITEDKQNQKEKAGLHFKSLARHRSDHWAKMSLPSTYSCR